MPPPLMLGNPLVQLLEVTPYGQASPVVGVPTWPQEQDPGPGAVQTPDWQVSGEEHFVPVPGQAFPQLSTGMGFPHATEAGASQPVETQEGGLLGPLPQTSEGTELVQAHPKSPGVCQHEHAGAPGAETS